MTGTRPFRVGDRVRWIAPRDMRDGLERRGYPRSADTTIAEIVPASKSPSGLDQARVVAPDDRSTYVLVPLSWCLHLDDEPARSGPSPTCRWCHGTGAVLLVFSHAPCECVGGGT